MSRSLHDQFIDDDEEETCPLCVEEFDLTDKGFRPCPCGYQICQFCYHNVKTNMNGLCPACRRPYCDDDIEYKVITPEETAAHKARQAQKQKKTQAALQKEKQKAEADNLSRKHLAGMRVVQKNLVYVTGLSPTTQEDQLLQTLRGEQYFGQYGKITKIVVSKAKDHPAHQHSVGVYVTYERKEDAASCIAAVDGSKNGDRTLRAQFGTTKYCSAYLRGETCTNRNCMFLHEPGEANESYSRADLSALNANSSQHGLGRPPPQSQQPVASASQPMARQPSDQAASPAPERPALPSTASWASKVPQASRAESRSTSTTLESPAPVHSIPVQEPEPIEDPEPVQPAEPEEPAAPVADPPSSDMIAPRKSVVAPLTALMRNLKLEDFKLAFSPACLPQADLDVISNYPPLFDENGGAKRRLRKQREEELRRMEQEIQAFQQPPPIEQEDNPEMSGSLQLGGEPEERQTVGQVQSAIQPPGQDSGLDQRFLSSPGISDRGLTPQQHQQMLLQTLKPNTPGYPNNGNNQPANFQSSFQQPNTAPLGHQRNVSRFSFANESSASAAVKPVANPKLMNQQSSMMPSAGGNHFGAQHQQPHGQFYTSNVQGPPPGLKTTGTPPISGNLTFGQGHGFATGGPQYGTTRNQQDNYYRDLLRGRDAAGSGMDAKRELHSFPNYNTTHPNAAYPSAGSNAFPNPPYASLGAFGDGEKQRKKKGKKHRHANTSSSSGGGVVDVSTEPNANHLLQARLHQGAGMGGGAFAGQTGAAAASFRWLSCKVLRSRKDIPDSAPSVGRCAEESIIEKHQTSAATIMTMVGRASVGRRFGSEAGVLLFTSRHATSYDIEFPPLGPVRQHNSASRVSLDESRRSTPPVPPGFEGQVESRRGTPTVPIGPTKPTALPDLEGPSSRPGSRPSSRASLRRATSQIMPVLPLRPGTPARITTPSRKTTKDEDEIALPVETPTRPSRTTTSSDLKKEMSVQEVKEPSSERSEQVKKKNDVPVAKRGEIVADAELVKSPEKENVPVVEKVSSSNEDKRTSQGSDQLVVKGKAHIQAKEVAAVPETPTKAVVTENAVDAQKRKHPGKLDIAAAVNKQEENQHRASTATPVESATPVVDLRGQSHASSTLKALDSPSVASPAVKIAPKTLRVVQTPKTEAPPVMTLPSSIPSAASAHKLPSRKPSTASINPPGTPSSEQVSMSDNISLTSTSQSRANSPPPAAGSKVGSAAVRTKTKSQLKKERQERAKAIEEEKAKNEEVSKPTEEETIHEAIIGRQKKKKKESQPKLPNTKAKTTSTPAPATTTTKPEPTPTPTPSLPVSPAKPVPELPTKTEAPVSVPQDPKPATPTKPTTPQRRTQSPKEPASPPPTPTLTAAQLIAELKASAPEIQKCIDSLFRVSNSHHFKASHNVQHKDLLNGWKSDFNVKLTRDEIDALLTGKVPAVHRGGEDGRTFDKHMVAPSGAHLRALTKELEARFLELEKALREMPDEFRFRPSKPQDAVKLPAFDLEDLKRKMENGAGRQVSVMEQMVQDGSTMKKGAFLVDEASKYINEFVMPPATPPPSGGQARVQAAAQASQAQRGEPSAQSVDILEQHLHSARRSAETRELDLKKTMKKNKKMLGMS